MLASYSSPRTFLTLKDKRLNKLNSKDGIKEISEILELKLKDDKIILDNLDDSNRLIKYLCFKIFQNKEDDHLVEVTSVVNEDLLKG